VQGAHSPCPCLRPRRRPWPSDNGGSDFPSHASACAGRILRRPLDPIDGSGVVAEVVESGLDTAHDGRRIEPPEEQLPREARISLRTRDRRADRRKAAAARPRQAEPELKLYALLSLRLSTAALVLGNGGAVEQAVTCGVVARSLDQLPEGLEADGLGPLDEPSEMLPSAPCVWVSGADSRGSSFSMALSTSGISFLSASRT
jgi:hypothetical protein